MYFKSERMRNFNINIIYIIGIGGIGMSGIAEILINSGYKVQGSDLKKNALTERLEKLGAKIFYEHKSENIKEADIIVKSSAINDQNPEIIGALENSIQIVTRAEIVAEIIREKISVAISGTHGKTTTTNMIGCMLESAGLDPTIINGGIINNKENNIYIGKGDYLVVEADESDASFIKLSSTISVITNMNPEHLDFYGNFENMKQAYKKFVEDLPFYGFAILCKDHTEVNNLISNINNKKIISYGIDSEDADIRAINIRLFNDHFLYDILISKKLNYQQTNITNIYLPAFGIHNVLNSLAAISLAIQLKLKPEIIQNSFKNFSGTKRRFTKTGEFNNIKFIDDYAHHPVEIRATLQAAKSLKMKRVIAIFQPHRYSRVKNLFFEFINSFNDVDMLFVTDIYSAGEKPITEITTESLIKSIKESNKSLNVQYIKLDENFANSLSNYIKEGDLVIFLGAGDITNYAYNTPEMLKKIFNN